MGSRSSRQSHYRVHKFMLTYSQLKKVKRALDNNEPYNLTINKDNLHGEHPLPVTENEEKNIKGGEGIKITLSKKKLSYMKNKKEGGFLPFLPLILGGLAAVGSIAGGSAAIAQAVNKNKVDTIAAQEQVRHNKELEQHLKTGTGMESTYSIGQSCCVNCGTPLILKAKKGKGLYLKPYNSYTQGDGLINRIVGKDLPPAPEWLKSIPGIG